MICLHDNFQRLTARPTELKMGIFLPMRTNWGAYFVGGNSIKRKKKAKKKAKKAKHFSPDVYYLMSSKPSVYKQKQS